MGIIFANAQSSNIQIPMDKVLEWRRHIHQNPELSFKEHATSKYVEERLKSFGNIEVIKPTPTSLSVF